MKKKILFAINSMSFGGIQKALLNLLSELSKNVDYEITVLLIRKKGELLSYIPDNIKIVEANCFWRLLETTNAEIKRQNILLWIIRSFLAVLIKKGKKSFAMKLLSLTQRQLLGFDYAISYRQPDLERNILGGSCEFVLNCCKAKEKIVFIHCDYSKYGGMCNYNNQLLSRFDKIAVVSESCKNILLDTLPDLKNKVSCVYNCHDFDEILNLSNDNSIIYDEGIHFVTVCRLGREKGIDRTLEVLAKLKELGYDFKWHIVGDGEERKEIEQRITVLNLNNNVVLEGETANPYRFVKNATFFFLPSYHEAAPMVIGEAFVLGVPVISTKTASADELVKKEFGIVCPNSEQGIYDVLKSIFDDVSLLDCIKHNLNEFQFSNENALQQFDKLIS